MAIPLFELREAFYPNHLFWIDRFNLKTGGYGDREQRIIKALLPVNGLL